MLEQHKTVMIRVDEIRLTAVTKIAMCSTFKFSNIHNIFQKYKILAAFN